MDQPKPRTVANWAVVFTMLLFLSGCDKEPEKHRDVLERGNGLTPKDMDHEPVSELPTWDQERRDALLQLRTLRNGLYTDLAAVNTLFLRNQLDPEQHGYAYSRQVDLMRENARLDSMIYPVESCDAATWLNVKDDAHQISEAVARWRNHLKEKADPGTHADNEGP